MTREPLVDEREVGVEQVDDAAVLLHDRAEEQLRLALERLAQIAVPVGRIRPGILQVAEQQPLAGEVVDERLRPRIRQHAAHLLFERRRILQRAASRLGQQLLVRDAAPEEERQPRRQLVVTEAERRARRDARRLAFETEEELRIDEHARDRPLDSALERAALAAVPIELQQRLHVRPGGRNGPTIGARRRAC